MAKPRPTFLDHDTSPNSLDSIFRWSEYLNPETVSPSSSWNHAASTTPPSSGTFHKARHMESVFRLSEVAEGLLTKMYRLNQKLDYPDPVSYVFSDSFWKGGMIPNHPRICLHIAKKFPEHTSKLQLERVDKIGMDALHENVESYMESLEPLVTLLLDLMVFREQALRLILDLSSTVITLLPHQNSLILHAFMDLFCSFVRVNLFSEKMPRKMILQTYNLLHSMLKSGRDYEYYHRLVQFIDSYDPPLKGLHEDLNFVSPRIGEVLEAVGPIVFLSTDTKKLRNEGFLSPFHPRYPDILTNSAHPMRAQDLANVSTYRDWVLIGYLVCPSELLRITGIDIAMVVLKENLILTLFKDEYILLHEDYQSYVLPWIMESKKMAKSGRTKQKEADLEYNIAKQVEKMICDVQDQALMSCDAIHHERRVLLKQEIGRMVLFFTDLPSLLAPNIQMVFSAMAFAQYEVLWYFQHIGVASSKSRAARVISVEIDANDPTLGFLLDGMDRLCCLVRKYVAAIRGYALSYLASSAERIRFLLGTPGMVALDIDATLRSLFQQMVHCLETLPKSQRENMSAVTCDLSELRKTWLSILMIVTSSRSAINIRHLEKATVSTGKESLVSEGNAVYSWSRCVDELESQLSRHGSLRKLYFYHHHLTAVFRNTMFGPEGRPQHCCAWLGVASSFPENACISLPEEVTKVGRDAVAYVESLIESIMGGLEGLINILDSDSGLGSVELQLLPEQAAIRLNHASRASATPVRPVKGLSDLPLPGHESCPENSNSIKMIEAAMQRLTNLCSVLNEMEPICVLNHVFVLREYMRDCILSNFKRRLLAMLKTDTDLQRPSVLESMVRRHMTIVHITEQHVSMDLTEGLREALLTETFSGPIQNLHQPSEKPSDQLVGPAVSTVCEWYIDNIVKDINNAGILFAPKHKCFKSARPVGGFFAESVTNATELKAFVRLFGMYGVDQLDRMMSEHVAALINCIDIALKSNKDSLEAFSSTMHNFEVGEMEGSLKQVVDVDTTVGFCVQAGRALAFGGLLAEATREVMEENVPLVFSMLTLVAENLPEEMPERTEIARLRAVASSIELGWKRDTQWVRSILMELGGATDGSWSLLPYLFTTFMMSGFWGVTTFNVDIGGFTNNIHCLARCMNAVIAGSEFVRVQRREMERVSNEAPEAEAHGLVAVEASIKSMMQLFVKSSTAVMLDSGGENNRSNLVSKIIFLDHLCEMSPYLPRTTLESHVPYSILRSLYHQYYGNCRNPMGGPLSLLQPSPRHSPSPLSLAYTSPRVGRATLELNGSSSTSFKASSRLHEVETSSIRSTENRPRHVRNSGPLEYSSSRKVTFVEGSNSGSTGPSPLPRFAVSRSGPISYK
ncbi:hypothetical protein AMTRI_Chr02g257710 [Amborella trichopoda]